MDVGRIQENGDRDFGIRNKETLVYALLEPDTLLVRYFGITTRKLSTRFSQHICESQKAGNRKCNWVLSLLRRGVKPKMVEIARCSSLEEGHQMEIYLILLHKMMGAKLVNGTAGGEGVCDPSSETRAKISATHKGRVVSLESRKKMSKAQRARPPVTEEQKKKLRKIPEDTVDSVVGSYLAGESSERLAIKFRISHTAVCKLLRRKGLKTRTKEENLSSYRSPAFMSKMQELGKKVSSLPKAERVLKYTAPARMLEESSYSDILRLKGENPLWSLRRIAKEAGTNHHTVKRCIERDGYKSVMDKL